MDDATIAGYVQLVDLLISLGYNTAAQIGKIFGAMNLSPADLTPILTEVTVRLARRSPTPSAAPTNTLGGTSTT